MFRRRFSTMTTRALRSGPRGGIRAAWVAVATVWGFTVACGGEPTLSRVSEDFWVVPGAPGFGWAPPGADVLPRPDASQWGLARARHCDRFRQNPSPEVDILLVVDSSEAMAARRSRLASAAGSLLEPLLKADHPIDVRIGLVSAGDRGEGPMGLLQLVGGQPWLSCTSSGTGRLGCNVGSVQQAAVELGRALRAGSDGSTRSVGLLAASLALDGRNGGFLRSDASLNVVFAAAEDDTACAPHVEASPCLASDSCRCDDTPDWGSTGYFQRFFRGLKGYGNESSVRIGALVAVDEMALKLVENRERSWIGCTEDEGRPCGFGGGEGAACAFHAPRYLHLAASTGGITGDICSNDYSPFLEEVGQAATGLQRVFRLSRVPIKGTIDIVVVPDVEEVCNDADTCSAPYESCVRQKCARRLKEGLQEGWEHVFSSDETEMNAIRFGGASIPEPLHTIEVCYDVDVGG